MAIYIYTIQFLILKGGCAYKHKESTADIYQFLQQVEVKFSDVLIPTSQIVTQGYLGKGMYACIYISKCMHITTYVHIDIPTVHNLGHTYVYSYYTCD